MQTPELRSAAPAAETFTDDTYDTLPSASRRSGRRVTRAGAAFLALALVVGGGTAACGKKKRGKSPGRSTAATASPTPKKVTDLKHGEAYTLPQGTRTMVTEADGEECEVVGAAADQEGYYAPAELQGSKPSGGSKKRDKNQPPKKNTRTIKPGEACEPPEVQLRVCLPNVAPDPELDSQENCINFDVRTEVFTASEGAVPEHWFVITTKKPLAGVADLD
jgi:hypothetical protein